MYMNFLKFEPWWTELDKSGHRGIREDAPQEIKDEAKRMDKEHFERTGRHMLRIDY